MAFVLVTLPRSTHNVESGKSRLEIKRMKRQKLLSLFIVVIVFLSMANSSDQVTLDPLPTLNVANEHPQGNPAAVPIRSETSSSLLHSPITQMEKRTHSQSSGLNFAPAMNFGSGGNLARSAAVADLNGDGNVDLVVANQDSLGNKDGSVSVLLGNGDGTFQVAVAYDSGGLYSYTVSVADLNGDGKPDLVVTNQCSSGCSTVGVLLGNGDGTFQSVVTYSTGGNFAYAGAVADVNKDGKPDLLVANACLNSSCTTGAVGVLMGNGDGTFQNPVSYDSGGEAALGVTTADINSDGNLDLLIANECADNTCANGSVAVLLGNGDGTFKQATAYNSGAPQTWSVAVSDLNNDGRLDLVSANAVCSNNNCGSGQIGVLLGNGDGTFQPVIQYESGGVNAYSVAIADVNGDGIPDVVVANGYECTDCSNGTAGVLLGEGNGTFQPAVAYSSGGFLALSITVSDVNKDGRPDLLLTNICASQGVCEGIGSVGVLLNTSLTPTATLLNSSPNPSSLGQTVSFTATVTALKGFNEGTPTGIVSFLDGTTNLGFSSLTNGIATLQIGTLSVGTHNITASYSGDANFALSTSGVLNQVVQGAIAVVSPTNLNFSSQTVGIKSAPQAIRLMNAGNIGLTISIAIAGGDPKDFSQTNNCPSSLPPNASCMVSVTFDPIGTGTQSANLVFTDNAPNSPQLIPLSGVGVVPAVTFSPTTLTFPTQVIYTYSKAQVVTLTNTGLGILKFTGGTLSGQFGATTTCSGPLKSGASCNITVIFKPRAKGILNGDISVTDNAPDSPQKLPLTGTGTFVQLKPTNINFGDQPINTTSLPKYITFTNQGTATVNISSIVSSGADSGDFAVTNNCGASVAVGASCFIKVTFTPLAQGQRMADVLITDDGGGSPQNVPLLGRGTP